MRVELLQPSPEAARRLLMRAESCCGMQLAPEALPGTHLLQEGLSLVQAPGTPTYRWGMPHLICLSERKLIVGTIGGKGLLPDEDTVEIGYNVAPTHRRAGIATRAIALTCEMALADGLHLLAHIEVDNEGSRRALERNGFIPESMVDWPGGVRLERWRWSPNEH